MPSYSGPATFRGLSGKDGSVLLTLPGGEKIEASVALPLLPPDFRERAEYEAIVASEEALTVELISLNRRATAILDARGVTPQRDTDGHKRPNIFNDVPEAVNRALEVVERLKAKGQAVTPQPAVVSS